MEHSGSSLRKLAESRGLEFTSSKQTLKKVEVIELVRQQRAEKRQELIYSARPFVLCGMPLKRPPAGTLTHRRRNGRFFLQIHGHPEYGLPFGQDRLVAIWAVTQAVRNRSRIVEFQSGAQILEEFGLPHNGVSYRRLTDGFKRVFGSTIYFGTGDDSGRQDVFDCARFCFFDRLRVWCSRDDHREGNLARLPNRIELSERFWEEVRAHPVPGELNVVRGLANSPGCLDFYLWLTWRCHLARGYEKIRLFGPTGLQVQLGSDEYLRARDFRRTIARWLATVRACWPECPVRLAPDGENIHVFSSVGIQERVNRQLGAMGVPIYTVGVLTIGTDGKYMERFTWDRDRLLQSLPWLKAKNASGANINIGPFGEHGLSLIDDLRREGIQKMKDAGFQPALVVETSPNNFQAWVNHGQVLEQSVRGAASRRLAQMFDGDPSAAAHNHLGRLSGFTNRKEIHRSAEGKYPWVHLVEATGQPYSRTKEFIVGIEEGLRQGKAAEQKRDASSCIKASTRQLKTIDDFRQDPRYRGDNHAVDFAYAMYARGKGVDREQVAAAIATRDLSHKAKNYVDYTIRRAERKIGAGPDVSLSL